VRRVPEGYPAITELNTDLAGRRTLTGELDVELDDVRGLGLEPCRRCAAVGVGRGRCRGGLTLARA